MTSLRSVVAVVAVAGLFSCGIEQSPSQGDDAAVLESELGTLQGRFETFIGRDGQTYFHLLAGNGEKVLASEGYATLQGAEGGIASVKTNGVIASRYLLREASNGQWYFVLVASNGQIIGVSEMYVSRSNATTGMETVQRVVTQTLDQGPAAPGAARFEVFKGLDGKYYFHARARNGQIVLQSQGYTAKSSANDGVASVQTNGVIASRYTVLPAADGQFYFVLKAANGQVIAVGESYASRSNAERGVEGCVELLTAGVAN